MHAAATATPPPFQLLVRTDATECQRIDLVAFATVQELAGWAVDRLDAAALTTIDVRVLRRQLVLERMGDGEAMEVIDRKPDPFAAASEL